MNTYPFQLPNITESSRKSLSRNITENDSPSQNITESDRASQSNHCIITRSVTSAAAISALANQNRKFQKLDVPANYVSQSTRHIFLSTEI